MANHPSPLVPGVATGIGSLPHTDPVAAAHLVLRALPELPVAPQLPNRSSREQMLVQWLRALPEITIEADGTVAWQRALGGGCDVAFDPEAHGGLVAFIDAASMAGVSALKVQATGPLTMGLALQAAGMPLERAIERAVEAATAWGHALVGLVHARVPAAAPFVVFDEPALVAWTRGRAPVSASVAADALAVSIGSVAALDVTVGVHACGDADLTIATAAEPHAVLLDIARLDLGHGEALGAHLDRGGWIGWGAIPTDAPVGDAVDMHWRALERLWAELAAHGCGVDAMRLRGFVHPACGLAGHSESQAEHLLELTRALGTRMRLDIATGV